MEKQADFEWDSEKDRLNQKKHGVSFASAQLAFLDHQRVIFEDLERSADEKRYYCLGRFSGGILTVRFTTASLFPGEIQRNENTAKVGKQDAASNPIKNIAVMFGFIPESYRGFFRFLASCFPRALIQRLDTDLGWDFPDRFNIAVSVTSRSNP